MAKKLESPFIPKEQENFDKKYCQLPDKIGNQTLERYQNFYKNDAIVDVFNNYSFDNIISIQNNNNNNNNIYSNNNINKSNNLNNKSKLKIQINNNNNNHNFTNLAMSSYNSTNKKNYNQNQNQNNYNNNYNFYSNINANENNNSNANNNNINYNSNSFTKNSINNLLKNKMKITDGLFLNQNNNNLLHNNHNSNNNIINNNLNVIKNKIKINFSSTNLSGKQINPRSFKISLDKYDNKDKDNKLPLIDNKNTSKHISSHSVVNNKNFYNTPVKNHNQKYSSMSNNSTGSTNMSMNFLHKRSGSTYNY